MEISALHIAEYRAALAAGAAKASPQERDLYALHERAVDQLLTTALDDSSTKAQLLALLQTERRAFGWSYLSGEAGAQVEASFQSLFLSIVNVESG